MTSQDLLSYCHYYKGEIENPYTDKERIFLWEQEYFWSHAGETNNVEQLTQLLQEYIVAGYAEIGINDDTPITLKALLLNRYCKQYNLSLQEAKEAFKLFYSKYYS